MHEKLDPVPETPKDPESGRSPRVVMLLTNHFTHDTRVHKQAVSLNEIGCEVHVVCLAKAGLDEHEVRSGIRITRVPLGVDAPLRLLRTLISACRRGALERRLRLPIAGQEGFVPGVPASPVGGSRARLNASGEGSESTEVFAEERPEHTPSRDENQGSETSPSVPAQAVPAEETPRVPVLEPFELTPAPPPPDPEQIPPIAPRWISEPEARWTRRIRLLGGVSGLSPALVGRIRDLERRLLSRDPRVAIGLSSCSRLRRPHRALAHLRLSVMRRTHRMLVRPVSRRASVAHSRLIERSERDLRARRRERRVAMIHAQREAERATKLRDIEIQRAHERSLKLHEIEQKRAEARCTRVHQELEPRLAAKRERCRIEQQRAMVRQWTLAQRRRQAEYEHSSREQGERVRDAIERVRKRARAHERTLDKYFRRLTSRKGPQRQWLRKLLKRLPPGVRLIGFNDELAHAALAREPDLVIAHDANTLLAGTLVKRAAGVPLVYDSHELFLERNIGDKRRWADKLMWWPVERGCIRRANAVFTVAEGIACTLEKRYRIPEVHLLRNVQPYTPPPPPERRFHDEFELGAHQRIVIYHGAITINRGLEQLIDSAHMLKDAVFVVMGYANNASYLEALIRRATKNGTMGEQVFFKDAVPVDEVGAWVASADLGVVPTQGVCMSYRFEASNKMFHCMMAGVPLAMSDHPEKRILSQRLGIGELFDETSPASIAECVNRMLRDHVALESMRARCLEAARTLNWEHEQHRYLTILADLLPELGRRIPEIRIDTDDNAPPSMHVAFTDDGAISAPTLGQTSSR